MVEAEPHIMTVDCCEHMLVAFRELTSVRLTATASRDNKRVEEQVRDELRLIIVGVARYPVRRLFISQLWRIYPNVPLLILRRDEGCPQTSGDCIRGEFLLGDEQRERDLDMVRDVRLLLPLSLCSHTSKASNYDTVREVVRVLAERYSDPELDLKFVARELPMSPARLSRILNRQVGVSFRQLLRHTRIEEAKRMLVSRRYSVKEVAARVGFTDRHYFSRSFKELTGSNASEYNSQSPFFG